MDNSGVQSAQGEEGKSTAQGLLNEYTLWLVPELNTHDKLQSLIVSLGARFNTPVFAPHITLLTAVPQSSISALTSTFSTLSVPASVASLPVTTSAHSYWQCVLLPIALDSSLSQFRDAVANHLNIEQSSQPNPQYYPHLSLMYGNLNEEQREDALSHVHEWFLNNESIPEIPISHVSLMSCYGTPEEWIEEQRFPTLEK